MILSQGRFHYADITQYENCAQQNNGGEEYAHLYWKKFVEGNFDLSEIEVLADSALYFPNWETFGRVTISGARPMIDAQGNLMKF